MQVTILVDLFLEFQIQHFHYENQYVGVFFDLEKIFNTILFFLMKKFTNSYKMIRNQFLTKNL